MPAFGGLRQAMRQDLAAHARVYDAPFGTVVVRAGEQSDSAYSLIDGRIFASRSENGTERVLEVHKAGGLFGEIATITGVPRIAVAEQPTTLLQVPASSLPRLRSDPDLNRVFLTTMTERMARLEMIELPRFSALDQATLRELRTPVPEPAAELQPVPVPPG